MAKSWVSLVAQRGAKLDRKRMAGRDEAGRDLPRLRSVDHGREGLSSSSERERAAPQRFGGKEMGVARCGGVRRARAGFIAEDGLTVDVVHQVGGM
jgi:hypothetical protein